jgi:SET domain-containing protein
MEDLHDIWKHRWVSPKVKAVKSRIHGWGAVATGHISKGEIVVVVGGVIVPTSQITDYRQKMDHIGIQIDDGFFVVPTSRKEAEDTAVPNHSCEPNIGIKDTIKYVAIRDILPGEELFLDYAFMESFFEPFKCNCGSKTCRKIITPDDWKNPELQRKYREFFSDYLKRKFRT